MNLIALLLLTLGIVLSLMLLVLRYRNHLTTTYYYRTVFIVVFLVPAAALGAYLWLGSPNISDHPLSQRRQAPHLSLPQKQLLEKQVQDLSQAIHNDNQNGLLWFRLGGALELLGRFDEASQAFARAYWLDRMMQEQSGKE